MTSETIVAQTGDSTRTDKTITSADVVEWLRVHPDFLQKHPEVCGLLTPPKVQAGRGVADFQYYMVQKLRSDKEDVLEAAREIVETSRANMDNQVRIHRAVLMLLEARNFEEFIAVLTMDIATVLDVDIAALVVETTGQEIPHVHATGVRVLPRGTVDHWMAGKQALLQSNIRGIEEIYGGGASLVASQALLRVDISGQTPPAILAFGSRDPQAFQPGQGIDQVIFLTRVVENCFRFWLDLPR